MNKFIVSGLLLLGLALLAGCGSGKQQDQQNTASKIGEPPTIERRIRACLICHGEAKGAMSSNFPNLDGQHKGYLIKQLTDMKSGRRRNWIMRTMASELNDEEIENIAKYFSEQKWKSVTPSADRAAIALGQRIYMEGNPNSQLTACISCHGAKGEGESASNVPVLAGQKPTYLKMQLYHQKYVNRAHFPESPMIGLSEKMSDKEIVAVSEYITTLK